MTFLPGFTVDPMSLSLSALVAGALFLARLGGKDSSEPLVTVLSRGVLSLVPVFASDLLWSVAAIALFPALGRSSREWRWSAVVPALASFLALLRLGHLAGGTDLATIASSEASGSRALSLLAVSVGAIWLVESRHLLRSSSPGLASRAAASFALQVAVASLLLRVTVWLPHTAPLGTIQAMALAALGAGALGALASTRITTYVTSLALARSGFFLLALLGGFQGRAPFLLLMAAGGVGLLLVALAAEDLVSLDEASGPGAIPLRLALVFGAFTASSLPPFPGFLAAFPLSSAVLFQGHGKTMIAAGVLAFLLVLGSLRLAARAWEPRSPASSAEAPSRRRSLLAVALAAGAMVALTIAPSAAIELATRAALEMH